MVILKVQYTQTTDLFPVPSPFVYKTVGCCVLCCFVVLQGNILKRVKLVQIADSKLFVTSIIILLFPPDLTFMDGICSDGQISPLSRGCTAKSSVSENFESWLKSIFLFYSYSRYLPCANCLRDFLTSVSLSSPQLLNWLPWQRIDPFGMGMF